MVVQITRLHARTMTREQEILEEICDYVPAGRTGLRDAVFSPAKLATFLAKHLAETEKPVGTIRCPLCPAITNHLEAHMAGAHPPTPKSEEKCCIGPCIGHVQGLGIPKTQPLRAALDQIFTPPSEEKKMLGMSVIEDPSMEPGTFKLEHRVSPTQEEKKCKECAEHDYLRPGSIHLNGANNCRVYGSPTPPDAWEESARQLGRDLADETDWAEWGIDEAEKEKEFGDRIVNWLRSRKKEWERQTTREVMESVHEGARIGGESMYNIGRTTTLEEVERVVEDYFKGLLMVPFPQATKESLLSRLKEMRAK